MNFNQFDILLVNFSPTKGSEQSGMRPCIVLETNGFHGLGTITIVCPITSNLKKLYPFEAKIEPSKANGLTAPSKLLLRQLRMIDRSRVKKYLGKLEKKYHGPIRESLSVLFDLRSDFEEI